MAESKNTFIQSKMNQDLDARIIPNGQYRSGLNVSISRSESADVGALETVLGNLEITDFGLTDCNLKAIGHYMDVANDRIIVFLTNYSDSSPTRLDNITGSSVNNVESYIAYYDIRNNTGSLLVGGSFLNFSKTHPIHGINLIEDLLFWTDNRNQPRKINISNAINEPYVPSVSQGYYYNEDQISVAKYYPHEAIYLLEPNTTPSAFDRYESGMKDVVSEWLPPHCLLEVKAPSSNTFITVSGVHEIGSGKTLDPSFALAQSDRITGPNIEPTVGAVPFEVVIQSASIVGSDTVIGLANCLNAPNVGDILYVQRRNPYYNASWPGDPDYLKDKFARFSYRFKFDDGEYSLIAPFTQIAFVPEQDGYFLTNNINPNNIDNSGPDQETETYRSTVVSFMENKANDITLTVPAPTDLEIDGSLMAWSEVNDRLKIVEVDILWKSADDQSIKVIETLPIDYFKDNNTSYLSYNYQSTKPWKTLPTAELTRVYDKVPVRALGQESAGNRIIYGNFLDKHTSPPPLDYTVIIDEKINLPDETSEAFNLNQYVRKEYQNHTLKQNRTYQVGVVLADRYGRQSDVILSAVTNGDFGKASTIYHPYRDKNAYLVTDRNDAQDPNDTWPGDQLITLFNNTIPKSISTAAGYPGLFSINDGSIASVKNITSFDPAEWVTGVPACGSGCFFIIDINGAEMRFEICDNGSGVAEINLESIEFTNTEGKFVNGEVVDVCKANALALPFCNNAAIPNSCFQMEVSCPENNPLGWYSYKIVVKQTEQEYYNVYLPGMLAGYPRDIIGSSLVVDPVTGTVSSPLVTGEKYPSGLTEKECHIVLINDNVNKVPRDLKEVGPDQQQFRSSVTLYGRVENKKEEADGGQWMNINQQYQPEIIGDTVTTIGPMGELSLGSFDQAGTSNLNYNREGAGALDPLLPPHWYSGDSNPLIARISTQKQIGQPQVGNPGAWDDETMTPFLSVYETKPIESLLDIYWETTTSGLISELNKEIVLSEDGVFAETISNAQIIIPEEGYADGVTPISAIFWAEGPNGLDLDDASFQATIELVNVTYADGSVSLPQKFQLLSAGIPGKNRYYLTKAYGQYQLAYEDPNKTNLKFIFEVTQVLPNPSGGAGLPITTTIVVPGIVTNEVPNEVMYPDRQAIKELNYLNFLFPSANPYPYGNTGGTGTSGTSAACRELIMPNLQACLYPPTQGNNYLNSFQYYTPTYSDKANVGTGVNYWLADGDPYERETGKGVVLTAPGYNFNPAFAWNGEFAAKNGVYGSTDPVPPLPISYQVCDEIVYEVVRAYQVSAILSYNQTEWNADNDRNNGLDSCVRPENAASEDSSQVPPPQIEYVFGQQPTFVDANGVGLANMVNGTDPSTGNGYKSIQYRLGMNQRVQIDPNSCPSNQRHYADQILNGPQYIDYQPNWGIPNPADNSLSGNGEKYVGEKYNASIGTDSAPRHYWVDLDAKMRFYTRRRDAGDPSLPANFWDNIEAAAFGTYNIWYDSTCGADNPNGADQVLLPFKYGNSNFDPNAGANGEYGPWPSSTNTALDYSIVNGAQVEHYQMQEINAVNIWGTAGPWSLTGTSTNVENGNGLALTLRQMPNLNASYSTSQRAAWSRSYWKQRTPHFAARNNGNCSWGTSAAKGLLEVVPGVVGGQEIKMPPGRYVVTVAAIDKNGSGLRYEWDIPVTIYETAIHEGRFPNGIGDGSCNGTGLLVNTNIAGNNTGPIRSSSSPYGCVTTYDLNCSGIQRCT